MKSNLTIFGHWHSQWSGLCAVDGEMREEPLLISPYDQLSSVLSDTCGLGSVNDGLCSKSTGELSWNNHTVMGRHNNLTYIW